VLHLRRWVRRDRREFLVQSVLPALKGQLARRAPKVLLVSQARRGPLDPRGRKVSREPLQSWQVQPDLLVPPVLRVLLVRPRLWLVQPAPLARLALLVQPVRRDPKALIRLSLALRDRKGLPVFRDLPDRRGLPARMGLEPSSRLPVLLWRPQMVCLLLALSAPGLIAHQRSNT
jgi:hypothetical protein